MPARQFTLRLQLQTVNTNAAIREFFATKMELTMRKKIITLFVVPLIAALAAQAATASERHHAPTKARVTASEQLRNSNAYFAAPGDYPVPSYWSNIDDGAMASGLAGH
jgi:hypothetical protein